MAVHHTKRLKKVQRKIRELGYPGLLVTDEHNVTYLSGFTGDSSYLLITPKSCLMISDTRYTIQLSEECSDLPVEIRDSSYTKMGFAAEVIRRSKLGQLAVESDSLSKSTFDELDSEVGSCELIDTTGLVSQFRAVKDKVELATIRQAIAINERAFEVIRAQLSGDQTEKQIAHNLEHQIRAFGGTQCAFDPIVGVGPRAALPHGVPSDARISDDSIVLIDWGTQFDMYASDLTRVLVTGKISKRFAKIYEAVLAAQKAAIAKIKPGVPFKTADRAARGLIEKAGFGKQFGHGLGHGFGLQIHENPFLSPIHDGVFEVGMVVTIEPGIYVPGFAGARIEDDVLVTRDGHEVLSGLPKELDESVVSLL